MVRWWLGLLALGLCASVLALDFAGMRALVERRNQDADPDNDIRSIDALISALPDTYKTNFTLMYRSGSLQSATLPAPRAILFGDDARLILTFNALGADSGGDVIESIEYQPTPSPRFIFREVRFAPGGVTFSADNPPRCLQCHTLGTLQTEDLRPNWDPYSQWPGALGSNADFLIREARLSGDQVDEFALYQDYLQHLGSLPRYRHLALDQLFPGAHISAIVFGERNKRLTNLLTTHNFDRITRRLVGSADYRLYRFALFAAIGCRDYGNRQPDIDRFKRQFFPAIIYREHDRRYTRLMQFDGQPRSLEQHRGHPNMALINYVLAPRGIDTRPWSTNVTPTAELDNPRFLLPKNAFRLLLAMMQRADPTMAAWVEFRQWQEHNAGVPLRQGAMFSHQQCQRLGKASREAFRRFLRHRGDAASLFPAA